MIKNYWLQLALLILIFILGMIAGANISDIKEFVKTHDGINLLRYATWFSALTAIVFWLWQIDQTRTKTEVEMALRMAEKFDSGAMTHHRVEASKSLLADSVESNPSVDALLNFFEEIDFLLDKRVISDDVAWNFFSYWVLYYCLATKAYRESEEKEGADMLGFGGIEDLYNRMLKVEKMQARKEGSEYHEIEAEDIAEFLLDESILEGKPESFRDKLRNCRNKVR